MSEHRAFKCDVCGVEKQLTNKWWKGYVIEGGGVMVIPWEMMKHRPPSAVNAPLPEYYLPQPDAHLCGEGHVVEWLSRMWSRRQKEEK